MAASARWPPTVGLLPLLLLPFEPAPASAATPARSPPSSASSAVFLLSGDVYPVGHYYVTMNIGDPAKPYFLDVDTGSDLTWLQCDAPCQSCNKVPHPWYRPTQSKLVPCANSLCTALHNGLTSNKKCTSQQQCDYQIKYTDSASSLGVLVMDSFSLHLRNKSNVRPSLSFGCGYDQQVGKNGATQATTDGLLGLGRGSVSLLSQLKQQGITKNVLGHCLSTSGGGFLFFGDDMVPTSRITWVPMVKSTSGNYYSPGSALHHEYFETNQHVSNLLRKGGTSVSYRLCELKTAGITTHLAQQNCTSIDVHWALCRWRWYLTVVAHIHTFLCSHTKQLFLRSKVV